MDEFIRQYGACILFVSIGLFFVIMSYLAERAGRSGGWFLGGLLIAVGFLTSPVKWLAVLGLVDKGYIALPYTLISQHIINRRFGKVIAEKDFADSDADKTKQLIVTIPDTNEEYILPYIFNCTHEFRRPKILFSLCKDKAGNNFLLYDTKTNGKNISIIPFDGECDIPADMTFNIRSADI